MERFFYQINPGEELVVETTVDKNVYTHLGRRLQPIKLKEGGDVVFAKGTKLIIPHYYLEERDYDMESVLDEGAYTFEYTDPAFIPVAEELFNMARFPYWEVDEVEVIEVRPET